MIAYFPKPCFIPVAISDCKLNCKHCMGRYLKQMLKLETEKELLKFGLSFKGNGILVSGGFDEKGRLINLEKMLPVIEKLKDRIYIAIHPGFVNEELADEMAKACDIAFVDLPAKNAIKNVLKLNATVEDYFENMEKLMEAGIKISPHITVGLNYGKIEEWELLDKLKNYKIEKLVLNFIVPTAKTSFENVRINEEEAIEFVKEAKNKVKNVVIGCMRPRNLDINLIEAGIKEIANPSKKALEYAKEKGIMVEAKPYCCGIKIFKRC